jgi:hypothetical protein
MKTKVTRKEINRRYASVYRCGDCALYPLFESLDAVGYNCGVYGWNYDLYDIGGIAITSGNRGMFGDVLPEECRRILKNARAYCRAGNPGRDRARRWAYIARARRNFVKALRGE